MALVPSAVHKYHSREWKRGGAHFSSFTAHPTNIHQGVVQSKAILAREDQDCVIRIILRNVRKSVNCDGGGSDDRSVNSSALPIHLSMMLHYFHPEKVASN